MSHAGVPRTGENRMFVTLPGERFARSSATD
jgi:hypothetical protein